MTAVNLVSCIIFTKGSTPKTKIQLYAMAVFFLFFLYTSPAGLVFYWTLNNIFSLIKTVFYKLKHPGRVLKILAAAAGAALLVLGLARYSFSARPVVKATLLLLGAALLLCSRRFEAETVSIAAAARLVDLSASPVFQQRFVEDMTLSEVTT